MSMTIRNNGDGSVSVTCGEQTVTVWPTQPPPASGPVSGKRPGPPPVGPHAVIVRPLSRSELPKITSAGTSLPLVIHPDGVHVRLDKGADTDLEQILQRVQREALDADENLPLRIWIPPT